MRRHEPAPSSATASVRRSRWALWCWALTLVIAIGLGVLFGRWAFAAPTVDDATETPATVTVAEMTVGQSFPLAVSATWVERPFGVGAASGVLTAVEAADGDMVDVGDRLYTVDLRPVVAAIGDVPAFRDLSQGARGADVAQIQQLLIDTGHLDGDVDGVYGRSTTLAVRAWQEDMGVTRDGVVRAGDVVFAARLPARVQLADEMYVGTRLAAGDVVMAVLDGEPTFEAVIPSGSSADPSLLIEVSFGDETVTAVVTDSRSDQSGNTYWTLAGEDGSPVCADRCDSVPFNQEEAVYPSRQVVVPEVTGLGVPAAAVWFTASGEPYVVLPDGTDVPVTIVGQGQGGVVLEGLTEGSVVVLADQTAPEPDSESS